MKNLAVFLFISTMLLTGCNDEVTSTTEGDWLIPQSEVLDGGPGRDGIPAVDEPTFTTPEAAGSYMLDDDLVLGLKIGNEIRAYSHPVLDWHEIINDEVNGLKIAVTYCPLTGTGIGWDRMIDGEETTFGVSGLLYNTNLIPFDRKTASNWSQMELRAVNGPLAGQDVRTYHLVETTWKTWKDMYPDTKIISTNTGFNRSYGVYPYGGYRTQENLLFPIDNDDQRLPRKTRVLGVIVNGSAKAYPITYFKTDTTEIHTVQDVFSGKELIVVGSESLNFAVAFERRLPDGTLLEFQPLENALPAVMQDAEGNTWDTFGEAISGPRAGQKLTPTRSYIGYWFAWGAFFEGLDVHFR